MRSLDTPAPLTARADSARIDGGDHGPCAARRWIEQHRLRVVLQPIVDLHDGELLAYEALLRSDGPAQLGPRELVEHALGTGCCGLLGRAVRSLAVAAAPRSPLFINAHPRELCERWLWDADDPIYHHRRPVHLEVTESAPLRRFEACRTLLGHLRERGIHTVVDDLGSGFSNLRHLASLEPRFAKLDRALIRGLAEGSRMHRLVTSLVELCAGLNTEVIAEGIETTAELRAVRAAGVRFGQGYLIARPAFPPPPVAALFGAADCDERSSTRRAPPSHVRAKSAAVDDDEPLPEPAEECGGGPDVARRRAG